MSETTKTRKLILTLAERRKSVPELEFLLDDKESFTLQRVGEHGSLNTIYRVQSKDKQHSFIMKHAQDTPSHEGLQTESQVSKERQTLEYNCLRTLHDLIPGCVPQPYCSDEQLHIIAMEDLSEMEPLGDIWSRGEIDAGFAGQLGELIGQIHVRTHRRIVSEETWKEYKQTLRNEDVRLILTKYRFDVPCDERHPIFALPEDCLPLHRKYVSEVEVSGTWKLIHQLSNREDCFVHADLHAYSILTSAQRIAMIDFEFGQLGHHGFSLSYLLAFYFFFMMEAQTNNPGREPEVEEKVKESMLALVEGYMSSFGDKVHVLGDIHQLFREIALFVSHLLLTTPCYIIVENLVKLTSQQKKTSLEVAYNLLTSYRDITSIDKLMDKLFIK